MIAHAVRRANNAAPAPAFDHDHAGNTTDDRLHLLCPIRSGQAHVYAVGSVTERIVNRSADQYPPSWFVLPSRLHYNARKVLSSDEGNLLFTKS
jgi:hypothetical protein